MMKKHISFFLFVFCSTTIWAQGQYSLKKTSLINAFAENKKIKLENELNNAKIKATQYGWYINKPFRTGGGISLKRLNSNGQPIFIASNNIAAVKTISSQHLWPGESLDLNIHGMNMHIGLWEYAAPRPTHQELNGKISLQPNQRTEIDAHATHIAGTMVGSGIDPNAKGVAYGAGISAYDWESALYEMSLHSLLGMLVSNHSYGVQCGFEFNSNDSTWWWHGDINVDNNEDYKFGFYGSEDKDYDDLAFNASNYLMVLSAGNDREDNIPDSMQYFYYNQNGSIDSSIIAKPGDGENSNGYNTIGMGSVSKNTLVVGSVNDIPNGYNQVSDVTVSSSSSWGPTDDGRIKPDIVANGVDVYSCASDDDQSYNTMSGTSIATASVSASCLLLQDLASDIGNHLKSATLKAIIINTTDEAGPADGPDYMYGWGLMNTKRAAEFIINEDKTKMFKELELQSGESYETYIRANGSDPIIATLCWTDPKGTPHSEALNINTSKLVNDLDLKLEKMSDNTQFLPWVLDPQNPSTSATNGDNTLDNIEQVVISNTSEGVVYKLSVNHKGSLSGFYQYFSLALSGILNCEEQTCTEQISGTGGEYIEDLAIDHNGNIIICGSYDGNVFPIGSSSLSSAASYNGFIIKYDQNNQITWSNDITGSSSSDDILKLSTASDNYGNVYVAGRFKGSYNFGGQSLTNNSNQWDMFLAKYSTTGNLLELIQESSEIQPYDINIKNDTIYVVGQYMKNIFFLSYDLSLNQTSSAFGTGCSSSAVNKKIASDSQGNLFVGGYMGCNSFYFYNSDSTMQTFVGNGGEGFCMKLDNNFDIDWKSQPNGCEASVSSICVDKDDNAYFTGHWRGSSCGTQTLSLNGLTFNSIGKLDGFIAKYNNSGTLQWVEIIGGIEDDQIDDIFTIDTTLIVVGRFKDILNLGGDSTDIGDTTLLSSGNSDGFIAKYDLDGHFISAKKMGGVDYDYSSNVVIDSMNNIYIAGGFSGTASMFGNETLNAVGSDLYIACINNEDINTSASNTNTSLQGGQDFIQGVVYDLEIDQSQGKVKKSGVTCNVYLFEQNIAINNMSATAGVFNFSGLDPAKSYKVRVEKQSQLHDGSNINCLIEVHNLSTDTTLGINFTPNLILQCSKLIDTLSQYQKNVGIFGETWNMTVDFDYDINSVQTQLNSFTNIPSNYEKEIDALIRLTMSQIAIKEYLESAITMSEEGINSLIELGKYIIGNAINNKLWGDNPVHSYNISEVQLKFISITFKIILSIVDNIIEYAIPNSEAGQELKQSLKQKYARLGYTGEILGSANTGQALSNIILSLLGEILVAPAIDLAVDQFYIDNLTQDYMDRSATMADDLVFTDSNNDAIAKSVSKKPGHNSCVQVDELNTLNVKNKVETLRNTGKIALTASDWLEYLDKALTGTVAGVFAKVVKYILKAIGTGSFATSSLYAFSRLEDIDDELDKCAIKTFKPYERKKAINYLPYGQSSLSQKLSITDSLKIIYYDSAQKVIHYVGQNDTNTLNTVLPRFLDLNDGLNESIDLSLYPVHNSNASSDSIDNYDVLYENVIDTFVQQQFERLKFLNFLSGYITDSSNTSINYYDSLILYFNSMKFQDSLFNTVLTEANDSIALMPNRGYIVPVDFDIPDTVCGGYSFVVNTLLKNDGTMPVNGLYLDVRVPLEEGFTVNPDSIYHGTLNVGDTVSYSFTINTPNKDTTCYIGILYWNDDGGQLTSGEIVHVVSPNDSITSQYTVNDVSCAGDINGSISTNISGQAPIVYQWSNGDSTAQIDSLVPGIYELTLTNGDGCVYNRQFEVNEPDTLKIDLLTNDNSSCTGIPNGSIDITTTGGTPPYIYTWSNGNTTSVDTGLSTGTYSITVTDSMSCLDNQSVIINNQTTIAINLSDTSICQGENLMLETLDTFANYLWSTTETTSSILLTDSGEYYVAVQDSNACIFGSDTMKLNVYSSDFSLTINANPTSFTAPPFNVSFINNTLNLNDYNFIWDFGDSTIIASNDSVLSHTYNYNGIYDVILIGENKNTNCKDTLLNINLISCTGGIFVPVSEIAKKWLNAFYNPTGQIIVIDILKELLPNTINIYNSFGQKVQAFENINKGRLIIDKGQLSNGLYFIEINNAETSSRLKLIIR